ncbi:hypothetical protein BG36_14670 [Aquamicrobium defluvii]|uniref:Uncharacterized protein n=1 Tax=Aquamicrobium defluvii TaxID=69279 RepID=A0A011V266_9HYPH|nr:hypothetical protein BG36_14670 [Aquamicrobium defluvii]EZQ13175.1 hypothetical protein CF98_29235 [Halopseudomonas bauzanensis]
MPGGNGCGSPHHESRRRAVEHLQCPWRRQEPACPRGKHQIGQQHDGQNHRRDQGKNHIVGQGDAVQIDNGRRDREIEHHGLGIAERQGQPAEETRQKPAPRPAGLDVLRRDAFAPEAPAKPGEIKHAEPFDDRENHAELLGNEGKTEHGGGQVEQIAEQETDQHGEGRAESGAQRPRDQCGDTRAGDGGGNTQRRTVGQEAGWRHEMSVSFR